MVDLLRRNWSFIIIVAGVALVMVGFSDPEWYRQYRLLLWFIMTLVILFAWLIRTRE